MLKQALALWQKERDRKGTTLHRRLILFFVMVTVTLIFAFTLLLSLFGITGSEKTAVVSHLSTEISIISDKISEDFGRVSLGGIAIAEDIAERSDRFFADNGITADALSAHPELIEPLLSEHMQTLISTVNNRYCGGAFILLDATVNPNAENADTSKAGVFLKKTQPTHTSATGVDIHYLRGPAQLARENEIMLLGQWRMEFDVDGQDFFDKVLTTAKENPALALSRLYYWSGRMLLKGNSESGFMLCVPLRSEDGTVFGLCGIEVSDRLFMASYTPEGGNFENIFTVMAPVCESGFCTSQGLIAGNYYLTGNHWDYDLAVTDSHDDFIHLSGGGENYAGKSDSIRLYPGGSPYEGQAWVAAVLMPKDILHNAVKGNSAYFMVTVVVLLLVSIGASVFISKRYLRPVNDALASIHSRAYDEKKDVPYSEINDLLEFLAANDRAHSEEVARLDKENREVRSKFDMAQTHITHLAEEKLPEVDSDSFEMFTQCLRTLTPKERSIFDLYMEGKSAKEILVLADINQNTLKFHNKNIYSKLGVTSRKQLLEYAALMKYHRTEGEK